MTIKIISLSVLFDLNVSVLPGLMTSPVVLATITPRRVSNCN